jgi:hypothetical protein
MDRNTSDGPRKFGETTDPLSRFCGGVKHHDVVRKRSARKKAVVLAGGTEAPTCRFYFLFITIWIIWVISRTLGVGNLRPTSLFYLARSIFSLFMVYCFICSDMLDFNFLRIDLLSTLSFPSLACMVNCARTYPYHCSIPIVTSRK